MPVEIVEYLASFLDASDVLQLGATDTHIRHALYARMHSMWVARQVVNVRTSQQLRDILAVIATLRPYLQEVPLTALAGSLPATYECMTSVKSVYDAIVRLPPPFRGPPIVAISARMQWYVSPLRKEIGFAQILSASLELLPRSQATALHNLAAALYSLPLQPFFEANQSILAAAGRLPRELRAAPLAGLARSLHRFPLAHVTGAFDQLIAASKSLPRTHRVAVLGKLPCRFFLLPPDDRAEVFNRLHAEANEMPDPHRGTMLIELTRYVPALPPHQQLRATVRIIQSPPPTSAPQAELLQLTLCGLIHLLRSEDQAPVIAMIAQAATSLPPTSYASVWRALCSEAAQIDEALLRTIAPVHGEEAAFSEHYAWDRSACQLS